MGQVSNGIKFGSQLCKVIGIDSTRVKWLTMRLKPGCAPTITAEMYIKEEDEGKIIELMLRTDWAGDDRGVHDVTSLGDQFRVSRFVGKGVEGGTMEMVTHHSPIHLLKHSLASIIGFTLTSPAATISPIDSPRCSVQ